jgi:hypothetical protein
MKHIWLLVALVAILDWFDRFYEKHATRLEEFQSARDVWFDFGYLEPWSQDPTRQRRRFFHLKTPSYEWAKDFRRNRYCWHQRVIWWSDGAPLRIQLWPVSVPTHQLRFLTRRSNQGPHKA